MLTLYAAVYVTVLVTVHYAMLFTVPKVSSFYNFKKSLSLK